MPERWPMETADSPAVRILPSPDQAPPAAPLAHLRDRLLAVEPLLVNTDQAAALCAISPASWFRLKSDGKTPAPVKLGGRTLYRLADLKLWVSLGCPDRKTFE